MSSNQRSNITQAQTFQDAAKAVKPSTDKATEQGFLGTEVDPTPNEHYTVAGVTKGLPTPETDAVAAAEARKVTGLGMSGLETAQAEKATNEKLVSEKRGKKL